VEATIAGTIARIPVRENQVVRQGDVLVELATSADRAQLETLQTRQQRLRNYLQDYQNQLAYVDAQLQIRSLNAGDRDRLLQRRTSIETQIRYDQTALQTIEATLSKQVIQAPTEGTVFRLIQQQPGQLVQPGDAIAQIMPKDIPLLIKARVGVQEISQVKVGQSVVLRISAYPYPDYGTLSGTVQAIAPDVQTVGEAATGRLEAYYEVTIQPERPYLQKGDRQFPLQPGMEARADIISRQETVLQTILRNLRIWADV
jgi:multidrug efflux pump subunit AcrA (membrane-fusion protein)